MHVSSSIELFDVAFEAYIQWDNLYPFHTGVQNTKEENRIEFFPIDQW